MPSGVLWLCQILLVMIVVGIGVTGGPLVSAIILASITFAIVAAKRPQIMAPVLALVGMLLIRPSIWGEQYSPVALGLFGAAGLISLIQDRGRLTFAGKEFLPLHSVLFWVTAAYLWLLVRGSSQGLPNEDQTLTGMLVTCGCLFAMVIVVAEKTRRDILAKGFVVLVSICCFSYVASAAVWAVFGVGAGSIGSMMIGSWPTAQPVYFPLTTTTATQAVFGVQVPRFVGFAREPGWMAMYGAVAYLLMPILGWRRKIVRVAILAGVLGTISTAGFGIAVVCIALDYLLNGRSRSGFETFMRLSFGLAVLGGALWVAFYAPIVGLDVKGEQNGISLSERSMAMDAGLWALMNDPFSGGLAADKVGAVNLIAAIAAYGVPFSAAIAMAAIMPVLRHPKRKVFMPLAAVILLTLVSAQPSLDSAWALGLIILAGAVALEPAEPSTKKVRPARSKLPGHSGSPCAGAGAIGRWPPAPTSRSPSLTSWP